MSRSIDEDQPKQAPVKINQISNYDNCTIIQNVNETKKQLKLRRRPNLNLS